MNSGGIAACLLAFFVASCGGQSQQGASSGSTGGSSRLETDNVVAEGGLGTTSGRAGNGGVAATGGTGGRSQSARDASGGATVGGASNSGQVAECPAVEPAADGVCVNGGLQCVYSLCAGLGSRTWTCSGGRWVMIGDESARCPVSTACPSEPPNQMAACNGVMDCKYTVDCCGTPSGTIVMHCTGAAGVWTLASATTINCAQCNPFPVGGTECSPTTACTNGAPPVMCFKTGCEGGVASARCVDWRWVVDEGCSK